MSITCTLPAFLQSKLSAEDVAILYGARWSVELIFKELKRIYQLDVINSGKNEVVESLVLVAMLTLVVSHRVLNFMRRIARKKGTAGPPCDGLKSFTPHPVACWSVY
ncbi:transposase [Moorella sulfitireducens]|uniref:transposase n=1 Tax=Neomoorella sulfitireducens TaxID=2972948 RepID=UPI003BF52F36